MNTIYTARQPRARGPRLAGRSRLPLFIAALALLGLAAGPVYGALHRVVADRPGAGRTDVVGPRSGTAVFTTKVNAPTVPGHLDLLVELDLTGSYYKTLPNVRRLLPEFRDRLRRESNLRMGVASFADDPCCGGKPGDVPYTLNMRLTANGDGLEGALAGLVPGNGGDLPESWLYATSHALTDAGFAPHAQHVLVLATDADSHHRGDGSGSTAPTVAEMAQRLVAAGVRVVVLMPRGSHSSDAAELARATGGEVEPVSASSDDLDSAISKGLADVPVDVVPQLEPGCPVRDAQLTPSRIDGLTGGVRIPVTAHFVIAPDAPLGRSTCRISFGPGHTVPLHLEVTK